MKINKKELYDFLTSNHFTHLYHSNTVETACSFIKNGGLLSRGAVEQRLLFQTPQYSDEKDKKFDVWNDIFLDSVDLHTHFKRANLYGPVLFKFKVEILLNPSLPELWITKDNPTSWEESQSIVDRYYGGIDELKSEYLFSKNKIQQKMITLKNTYDPLPFNPYLESIILDDPEIYGEKGYYFDKSSEIILKYMQNNGMDSNLLLKRQCDDTNCKCIENYSAMDKKKLREKFLEHLEDECICCGDNEGIYIHNDGGNVCEDCVGNYFQCPDCGLVFNWGKNVCGNFCINCFHNH